MPIEGKEQNESGDPVANKVIDLLMSGDKGQRDEGDSQIDLAPPGFEVVLDESNFLGCTLKRKEMNKQKVLESLTEIKSLCAVASQDLDNAIENQDISEEAGQDILACVVEAMTNIDDLEKELGDER